MSEGVNQRPDSAVAGTTGWLMLLACLNAAAASIYWDLGGITGGALVLTACLGIAIVDALPIVVAKCRSLAFTPSLSRVALRLLGLFATLAVIVICYDAFPFYGKDAAVPLMTVALAWWPVFLVPIVAYLIVADGYSNQHQDGLLITGLVVTGRYRDIDPNLFRDHVLSWSIKAFFLPIMFGGVVNQLNRLSDPGFFAAYFEGTNWIFRSLDLIFFVDLSLAATGYIATLKLLDWHIRAPDRSTAGWAACLICYPPFSPTLWDLILPFQAGGSSLDLGEPTSWIVMLFGGALIACNVIFLWATLSFGPRFSNLTNRGVITHGPYRWTKHPAYLAKIASWLVEFAPMLTSRSPHVAFQRFVMMLAAAFVYVARAMSEEKLLRRDPEYLRYSAFMDESGFIARFKRLFGR